MEMVKRAVVVLNSQCMYVCLGCFAPYKALLVSIHAPAPGGHLIILGPTLKGDP